MMNINMEFIENDNKFDMEFEGTQTINAGSVTAEGIKNALGYVPVNPENMPTKTSQLTNDSGFIKDIPSEYVTETELNAKGYLTQHQDLSNYAKKEDIPTVPTKTSQLTNDSGFLTEHQQLPTHLPNPQKLTFTGAVTGEYDGSNALSVEIPTGGSGGNYAEEFEITEDVNVYVIPFDLKKYRKFTINIYQPTSPQANIEIGLCIDKLYNSVKDTTGSMNAYFSLELINAHGLANNGKYAIVGYSRRNNNSIANTNYFAYLQYVHQKIDGLHLKTSGTEVISSGTKIYVRAWE